MGDIIDTEVHYNGITFCEQGEHSKWYPRTCTVADTIRLMIPQNILTTSNSQNFVRVTLFFRRFIPCYFATLDCVESVKHGIKIGQSRISAE